MIPRALAHRIGGILRASSTPATHTLTLRPPTFPTSHPFPSTSRPASHVPHQTLRYLSSTSAADSAMEEISELYATAQDEFEIAMEETEKVSVYAEEDRQAARVELGKLQEAYKRLVAGEDREVAEEVRRRVGQRVRELEAGVQRMEEMAREQD